VSLYLKYYW